MPEAKDVHFNPEANNGKARCGRSLRKVRWSLDKNDTTCGQCKSLLQRDAAKVA